MRSRFDRQLEYLNREMTEMGFECESIILLSVKALLEGNIEYAKQAKEQGHIIDDMEHEIESICLKLLLEQQPVAKDLRMVSAALKMITDMERIGDQAEDISDIIIRLNGRTGTECHDIRRMAEEVSRMVIDSVEAYIHSDIQLSKSVERRDDVVDGCFLDIKKRLVKMLRENTDDAEYALNLLMIAKYFERIGDHAVNISEWVEFSVTGVHASQNDDGDRQ